MRKVRPEEIGATDLGTLMQPPEQIYIATVINPEDGNRITTAHRSLEGAQARVEQYAELFGDNRDAVKGRVEPVPLMP